MVAGKIFSSQAPLGPTIAPCCVVGAVCVEDEARDAMTIFYARHWPLSSGISGVDIRPLVRYSFQSFAVTSKSRQELISFASHTIEVLVHLVLYSVIRCSSIMHRQSGVVISLCAVAC
jgi:hypothetical protein